MRTGCRISIIFSPKCSWKLIHSIQLTFEFNFLLRQARIVALRQSCYYVGWVRITVVDCSFKIKVILTTMQTHNTIPSDQTTKRQDRSNATCSLPYQKCDWCNLIEIVRWLRRHNWLQYRNVLKCKFDGHRVKFKRYACHTIFNATSNRHMTW